MKENTNGESSLASNCHFFHVTFLFNLELIRFLKRMNNKMGDEKINEQPSSPLALPQIVIQEQSTANQPETAQFIQTSSSILPNDYVNVLISIETFCCWKYTFIYI